MFDPWVGNKFGNSGNIIGGVRVLILGESHYCSPDKPELVGLYESNGTQITVEEYTTKARHPFFSKLTSVISGRDRNSLNSSEMREVWESVAFYNYIPRYVAVESRVPPSNEDFQAGAAMLPSVLDTHDIEAILVCGYRLWWWLLKGTAEGYAGDPQQAAFHDVGPALAARMMHPSAGFSWPKWRPMVETLLAKVKERRAVLSPNPG